MFITPEQLKAARALCGDMSQEELAILSDVALSSIQKFEQSKGKLHQNSIEKLINALQKRRVIFIDDGVRLNQNPVYEGPAEFRQFFDDVYQIARDEGGDICLFNGVPAEIIHWLGENWYASHVNRMAAIRKNFNFRVIIKEQDRQLIGTSFAEYRWFPKALFNDLTIYVFGDKVAFLRFSPDTVTVEVKREAKTAAAMRVLFNIAWEHVAQEVGAA